MSKTSGYKRGPGGYRQRRRLMVENARRRRASDGPVRALVMDHPAPPLPMRQAPSPPRKRAAQVEVTFRAEPERVPDTWEWRALCAAERLLTETANAYLAERSDAAWYRFLAAGWAYEEAFCVWKGWPLPMREDAR